MTRPQAEAAWEALDSHCLVEPRGGARRAREGPAPDAPTAALWPLSQVLTAAVDMAALDRDYGAVGELVGSLERYRRGEGYAPLPGERTRYYDDNAWAGLALWQLHHQTGATAPLEATGRAFRFVAKGADRSGGIRWVEGNRSRNTCATGPAVQMAARLHLLGGSTTLVDFARRHLAWLDEHLLGPDGLYFDNMAASGNIERTVWSYNQGTPMGAHALLYRATGRPHHLEAARSIADAALGFFEPGDGLWGHPPVFNAVFFRNLLALQAVAPGDRDLAVLDAYLERAWEEGRDERGLFTAGGIGSYDGRPTIDQAALVQLFALRCWPSRHWADIA